MGSRNVEYKNISVRTLIYVCIMVQETKTLSFKHLLTSFPADKKPAAASIDIISPHLCFICVLHLANEHGLSIHGCANLDDLTIHLPLEVV